MRKRFMIGFIALSGLASAQTDSNDMKAGLWKETMFIAFVDTITGKGVFSAPGGTSSENHCYSEEDMRQRAILLADSGPECQDSDLKMTGGKLMMHSRCELEKGMTFEGDVEGTYNATSLHLAGAMKGSGAADKIEMRIKWDARHVGPSCDAEDE